MFNTHEVNALSRLIVQEHLEERRCGREIRMVMAKRTAQRRLRREIERLLQADGSVQSVLDVLDHVVAETHPPTRQRVETPCCS